MCLAWQSSCCGTLKGRRSHSHERGAAEHVHSHCARQVIGLAAAAVLKVEGVQGLEFIRICLQLHLAQELILQDSVVPDLGGERGSWEGTISQTQSPIPSRAGGCLSVMNPISAVPAWLEERTLRPHLQPWARPQPF